MDNIRFTDAVAFGRMLSTNFNLNHGSWQDYDAVRGAGESAILLYTLERDTDVQGEFLVEGSPRFARILNMLEPAQTTEFARFRTDEANLLFCVVLPVQTVRRTGQAILRNVIGDIQTVCLQRSARLLQQNHNGVTRAP